VPSLSGRVEAIDQEFYGSMEGQESMKDDSHQIEILKARSAIEQPKLKPWQDIEKKPGP
jgi:hypothetical protein